MQTVTPVDQGPILGALAGMLSAGDPQKVEAGWREIIQGGTPLIEPDPDNSECSLVTFLYRADHEIENVVVFGLWSDFDVSENRLNRLADTDCWYRTYRMPNKLRASYWFSPNDSLVPWRQMTGYDEYAARMANFHADPLNPRTLALPEHDGASPSVLELPGAAPQRWSTFQPGVASGSTESYSFHSDVLQNARRIWIYTPPGYTPSAEPYCLLIAFDGEYYRSVVPTPIILDNLRGAGRLPPIVAVLVDNAGSSEEERSEARSRELPCYPPFADFLAHELVPWIRSHYHVSADPARVVLAGSSFGGLASAYAAFRYPDVFGNVLSQSGAFQWKPGHDPFEARADEDVEDEWLAGHYARGTRLALRFYLDVGVFDSRTLPGGRPGIVLANRHMRHVLQAKDYPLHYEEFCGGHDYAWWRETLANGLLVLLGTAAG